MSLLSDIAERAEFESSILRIARMAGDFKAEALAILELTLIADQLERMIQNRDISNVVVLADFRRVS